MILLGLGSNLGDSEAVLVTATKRLRSFARGPLRCSSLWRTSPVDCPPDSAPFTNAVVAFEPRHGLCPETLLYRLKLLERQFGRVENPIRHAPRELDIDLLLFGDRQQQSDWLEIPHPRATQRRFVLAPAAEIVPDLVWPGLDRTIGELLRSLDSDESAHKLTAAGTA